MAHAAIDELIRDRGSIVFTGSISSLAPGFGGVLYVPSKHAVLVGRSSTAPPALGVAAGLRDLASRVEY